MDLDAASDEMSRLEVVESSITPPSLETVLAALEGWGAAMRGGDIAAQRAVLSALIERIVPVRIGRGKYEVEIEWMPLGEGLRAAIISRADLAELSAA